MTRFRCTYATEWVVVKVRWRLSVDARERAALKRILTACPAPKVTVAIVPDATSSPSPTPTFAATPTPTPPPTPTPAAGGACDPNYSGYCVPIVLYDLDCGDIRHRVIVVGVDIHRFDSDQDGIGCESYP